MICKIASGINYTTYCIYVNISFYILSLSKSPNTYKYKAFGLLYLFLIQFSIIIPALTCDQEKIHCCHL